MTIHFERYIPVWCLFLLDHLCENTTVVIMTVKTTVPIAEQSNMNFVAGSEIEYIIFRVHKMNLDKR